MTSSRINNRRSSVESSSQTSFQESEQIMTLSAKTRKRLVFCKILSTCSYSSSPPTPPLLNLVTLILALILLIGTCGCLEPSHPRYTKLVKCRDNRIRWTSALLSNADNATVTSVEREMASCLKELLLTVGPRYRAGRGIPQLKIVPEDPLELAFIPIKIPQLNMEGNVTKGTFRGMAQSLTEEGTHVKSLSVRGGRGEIVFNIPTMRGSGDFVIRIDFLRALFPGADISSMPVVKGRISCSIENTESTLFLILRRAKDPSRGIEVANAGLKQKYGEIQVKMRPTFNGAESPEERRQQEALVRLMNDVSQNERVASELLQALEPYVTQAVAKAKYLLLRKGFDNIDLL